MVDIVDNSFIVKTIISRIRFDFEKDISLFASYGTSDLDYYIVPKTKRGHLLIKSFLLNSLGCDLLLYSWDEIEDISSCETPNTHVVADAEVLFYSTQEDLDRFNEIKNNIYKTLHHKTKNKMICRKVLKEIKHDFFNLLKNSDNLNFNIQIIGFFEKYLRLLATINKTYLHKGFQDFKIEVKKFKFKPYELNNKIIEVLNASKLREIDNTIKSLMFDLIDIVPGAINSFTNFMPGDIDKIFNRIRNVYSKIHSALEEQDIDAIPIHVNTLDKKTDQMINDGILIESFPTLSGFSDLKEIEFQLLIHEKKLSDEYYLFKSLITDFNNLKDINSPFI